MGGVRSPVTEAGAGEAYEAVVFVHGNPGSARDWDFAIPAVAELARVVAPDMPAFGAADRPREWPYTVNSYADHLAGILEQTGVSRAHLVLHDFGGPWGLQWAVDHPAGLCERDADRYRDLPGIPLAQVRENLAHAGPRRALPGDRHALGDADVPQPRQPQAAPQGVHRQHVRQHRRGHQAGGPEALSRHGPRLRTRRRSPQRCSRSTAPPWSSGAMAMSTSP